MQGHPMENGAAPPGDPQVVSAIRPMFLLADSQLLFWKEGDAPFLARVVTALEGAGRGLGISIGGGAIVHADLTVEPVRKALVEISVEDGVVRRALLMPGDAGAGTGAA